jgi:hypothetical protein
MILGNEKARPTTIGGVRGSERLAAVAHNPRRELSLRRNFLFGFAVTH